MDLKIQTSQIQVGIHDENLYTTAYDLSILAKYAMKNEKFMQIVKTTTYTLPSTQIHPLEDRILHNSNLLLDSTNPNYYYEYATGLKTGFTDPAGDCLVASAKKDDIEFIVVCLHAGSLDNGLREKFLDCKTLFDFAFDNYIAHYKNLQEVNQKVETENQNLVSENSVTNSKNQDMDFPRLLLKLFATLIILFAMKRIFFKKKRHKNRRKR